MFIVHTNMYCIHTRVDCFYTLFKIQNLMVLKSCVPMRPNYSIVKKHVSVTMSLPPQWAHEIRKDKEKIWCFLATQNVTFMRPYIVFQLFDASLSHHLSSLRRQNTVFVEACYFTVIFPHGCPTCEVVSTIRFWI